MAGKEKERDWDREMAEVDKLLSKLPEADPYLRGSGPTAPQRPASGSPAGRGMPATGGAGPSGAGWVGTWARVGLGLLIGIGMTQWPYTHGCGLKLWFYLLGVGTVIVAGMWSAISSWRRRLGLAHLLSQGLIVWGLVLAAREVLPRVGYARAAATWLCPEPPAPTPH